MRRCFQNIAGKKENQCREDLRQNWNQVVHTECTFSAFSIETSITFALMSRNYQLTWVQHIKKNFSRDLWWFFPIPLHVFKWKKYSLWLVFRSFVLNYTNIHTYTHGAVLFCNCLCNLNLVYKHNFKYYALFQRQSCYFITLNKCALVIFCSSYDQNLSPPPTEIMPFKFKCW